jgi:hypothetical protein
MFGDFIENLAGRQTLRPIIQKTGFAVRGSIKSYSRFFLNRAHEFIRQSNRNIEVGD